MLGDEDERCVGSVPQHVTTPDDTCLPAVFTKVALYAGTSQHNETLSLVPHEGILRDFVRHTLLTTSVDSKPVHSHPTYHDTSIAGQLGNV